MVRTVTPIKHMHLLDMGKCIRREHAYIVNQILLYDRLDSA